VLNKLRTRLILAGVMAATVALAATAATPAETTVSGNVAGWVKTAKLTGAAPASTSVTIAVHMALNNSAGLKRLVAEVSNPKGALYGRYLTPAQFASRFAPAAADVNQVKALLENAGMKDVTVGPHGVYVEAVATVAQLRTAFKVSQNLYSFAGRSLRASNQEPTVPAALGGKIVYIEGLDDTSMLRTPMHRSVVEGPRVAPAAAMARTAPAVITPPPVAAGNPSPYCNEWYNPSTELVANLSTAADVYGAAIPWLNCGYTPAQIQAAYGLSKTKYNGSGVTVAITDAYASPTLLADLQAYSVKYGLPAVQEGVNFSQIVPAHIYTVPEADTTVCGGEYGWWGEQSLDVAAVHSSAPGAHILFVGSSDCLTSLTVAFMNVVYNQLADVVTDSWSNNGESIAPGAQFSFDQAAMAGAALGMSILFSSGDNGDLSADNGVASGAWPSTSAYVTGVGGTTLLLQDAQGDKAEYGWGTYRALLNDVTVKSATSVTDSGVAQVSNFGLTYDDYSFYGGSGGGISLLEPQPSYQATAVPQILAISLNLASGYTETLPYLQRVAPDVAMLGDPYTGFMYGETFTIAGNKIADTGCKPISATTEFCVNPIGGTSVASPLMAGVIAVVDSKRLAMGEPEVGFANPFLYSVGSQNNGTNFKDAINQIIAPTEPVALLRGYAVDLNEARVITVNSVPFVITPAPYALEVCGLPICLGVNDVFNYTSLSSVPIPPTPAGYNDVTGLGVPWVPKLINEE
jgi:subtilase family serine protease